MEDAHLDYLCIYNPDLDDEEIQNQVVFAYSSGESVDDDNLRRIGLAQGVVEFAKGFADGDAVNTLETTQSRIVIKKIEHDNWWIVASASFSSAKKLDDTEYSSRELSSVEILLAEIEKAYRRWRMHYGSLQHILDTTSLKELRDILQKWWHAWCEIWCVDMNNEGVVGLFDGVRYTRGETSDESDEMVMNTMSKLDGLQGMLITRFNPGFSVESEGCVWLSNSISNDSADDIVRWIKDCEYCDNDNAFLDDTGFVYHYDKRDQGEISEPVQQKLAETVNATMHATMNATVESMNQLMTLMKMPSMHNLFGAKAAQDSGKDSTEDFTDGGFVIGLDKTHLDNESQELEEEARISKKSAWLELNEGELKQYSLIVYRRRPFTFTLVYEHQQPCLESRDTYNLLHLRLGALVEPLTTDLNSDNDKSHQEKFYFIVHDPVKKTIRTSLPDIPSLPAVSSLAKDDQATAEKVLINRLDLIHVHQAISQLILDDTSTSFGGNEQEKFLRTIKNWWVYWCQLPDGRQAIFARRWNKPSKPPDKNNGLLAVLGKDAKQWLDNYKHYDKV